MSTCAADFKVGDILYWRNMLYMVYKIKHIDDNYQILFYNISKRTMVTGFYRNESLEFQIL